MFRTLAICLTLVGVVGPAFAQGVASTAQQFGLLGTWALDCGKPASVDNSWWTYAANGDAVIRKDNHGPGGDESVDMLVRTAKVLSPDLLQIQQRGMNMPADMAADWETTVVLHKDGPNKIRIWKSTMGGKTTVDNGKVVGAGSDTWAMSRCK